MSIYVGEVRLQIFFKYDTAIMTLLVGQCLEFLFLWLRSQLKGRDYSNGLWQWSTGLLNFIKPMIPT